MKQIAKEVIEDTDRKYRKINDLILFTQDPKDVDIVLRAIEELSRVFIDIIPAYKIREDMSTSAVDDEAGAKKGMMLSKEVKQVRDYERFLLLSYQKYLKILEKLTGIRPKSLIQKARVVDLAQKEKLLGIYIKLRDKSVTIFCQLVKQHPHFNFRVNILQTVLQLLGSKETVMRKEVTRMLFDLLAHTDQSLLDFKVDILKELNKVVKSCPHEHME